MKEKTVTLPIRVIKEILRYVPRDEIEKIQEGLTKMEIKSAPADHLLRLRGIASIGGDAVEDTERIWG